MASVHRVAKVIHRQPYCYCCAGLRSDRSCLGTSEAYEGDMEISQDLENLQYTSIPRKKETCDFRKSLVLNYSTSKFQCR